MIESGKTCTQISIDNEGRIACGSPAQNPIDLQSIKLIWGQPNTATDRFLVRFRIPRLTLIDSIQISIEDNYYSNVN